MTMTATRRSRPGLTRHDATAETLCYRYSRIEVEEFLTVAAVRALGVRQDASYCYSDAG